MEGQLEYRVVSPRITTETSFIVSVSNCAWSITSVSSDNKETTYKQVYDGRMLSTAVRFPDCVRTQSTMGNDSTLGIESNDTPNSLCPNGAGPIWLAYASACKFAGATTGLTELVWFVSQELRRDHFSAPTAWTLEPQQPFLPFKVDYSFDSEAFQSAMAKHQAAPSGTGNNTSVAKWASYRATATTNIGSLIVPSSFYFEGFHPSRSPGEPSRLACSFRGTLTRASQSVPPNAFVHGLGTKTFVQDERLMSPTNPASFIRYVTTTNDIPATNTPEMLAAADVANRTQVPPPPPPTRWQRIKAWLRHPSRPVLSPPATQSPAVGTQPSGSQTIASPADLHPSR